MKAYLAKRFFQFALMLALVSVVSFLLIQMPPGSYVENKIMELQQLGGDASSMVEVEHLKARYGLDRPLWSQYLGWIAGIVTRGDFGESFAYDREVVTLIGSFVGYTVLISGLSLLAIYAFAIPLGVLAALKRHQWPDALVSGMCFVGMSVPEFLLALLVLFAGLVFFDYALLGLYSPGFQFMPWGWPKVKDLLLHLPIPVAVVAVNGTAGMMRIVRGNMVEAFGQNYVKAARAKGLRSRDVVWRHAFRSAVNPIISILGMTLPGLFSGSTIISIVLNLPTAGYLLFESLMSQDTYLAASLILAFSFLLLLGNLLADIALAVVDPRIRYD